MLISETFERHPNFQIFKLELFLYVRLFPVSSAHSKNTMNMEICTFLLLLYDPFLKNGQSYYRDTVEVDTYDLNSIKISLYYPRSRMMDLG
jgi:hypothetical protein